MQFFDNVATKSGREKARNRQISWRMSRSLSRAQYSTDKPPLHAPALAKCPDHFTIISRMQTFHMQLPMHIKQTSLSQFFGR